MSIKIKKALINIIATIRIGVSIARKLVIYTDGAARGNPGESASGYIIYENANVLHKHSQYNGKATNNYAEYTGIILALKWGADNVPNPGELTIEVYCDNELVVRQLNNEYKLKSSSLKPLNREVHDLEVKFKIVVFRNVPREDPSISAVDKALNVLLDEREKHIKTEKL